MAEVNGVGVDVVVDLDPFAKLNEVEMEPIAEKRPGDVDSRLNRRRRS